MAGRWRSRRSGSSTPLCIQVPQAALRRSHWSGAAPRTFQRPLRLLTPRETLTTGRGAHGATGYTRGRNSSPQEDVTSYAGHTRHQGKVDWRSPGRPIPRLAAVWEPWIAFAVLWVCGGTCVPAWSRTTCTRTTMHRIPPIHPRRERMSVRQWLAICGGTAQRMRRFGRRLTALTVFCVASVGWAACGHGEDGGPLLFDPSPGAISPPTANTPPPAGGWRAAGPSAGARRDYPQTGAPGILPANQRQAMPLAAEQQNGWASAPAVESATPHGARSPVSSASPAPAQGWRSWRPVPQSESAPAQSGQAPSTERGRRELSAGGASNLRPAPYAGVPPVSAPPAAAPRPAPASPQRGVLPLYRQGGPKNASSPNALPQTAQPRSAAPQGKEPWWERFRIGDGRILRALGIGRSEPDSQWTPLRQATNSAGADHRWQPSQQSDRPVRYAPGNQRKQSLGIAQNGNTRLQPQRPTLPQGSGGQPATPRMAPGSLNPTAPQRLPEQTPPASRLPRGMYRGQQAQTAAQRPNVFERAADSVQQWWSDLTQPDTARSASMPRPQALPRPRPFERLRQWLSTPLQSDRGIFGSLRSNQLSQNDQLPQDPFSKRREQWQAISEAPAGAWRLPPARAPVPGAQARPGSLWQPLRN